MKIGDTLQYKVETVVYNQVQNPKIIQQIYRVKEWPQVEDPILAQTYLQIYVLVWNLLDK